MLRILTFVIFVTSVLCQSRHNGLSLDVSSSLSSSSSTSKLYPNECNDEFNKYCSPTSMTTTADDVYTCFNDNYQDLTVKCANSLDTFYSSIPTSDTNTNGNDMILFVKSIFDSFLFQPSYYFITFGTSSSEDDYDDNYKPVSTSPCGMMDAYDDGDDDDDDGIFIDDDDAGEYNSYYGYDLDDGLDDESSLLIQEKEGQYYFSKPFPYILYNFITTGFFNTDNSNVVDTSSTSSNDISINAMTEEAINDANDVNDADELQTKGYLLDQ